MRILSIFSIKSDIEWCIHLSISLFLYFTNHLEIANSSPLYTNIFSSAMFACWLTALQEETRVENQIEYAGFRQDSYVLFVYL